MSAETAPSTSPFLEGLMAPIAEEWNDAELAIDGQLPRNLNGMFTRNGPNPQFPPRGAYHPFDGDGMVHAVYLDGGRARYRNRWIESKGLLAERKRGRACYGSVSEFSSTPKDVVDEAGFMKNNANTHFVRHAGRYLALMEAGKPTELDRELATLGEYDFAGKLQGPMTAHPKIDPKTGELVFFGYSPVPPYLRYHVADKSGALIHTTEIELPVPVMMHDFAMTENYAIFLDAPGVFDIQAMLKGEPGIRWEPERGTRIGVLPRHGNGDAIRWFEIETRYVVHFFNAWEEGAQLTIYAPSFDSMPGGLQFDAPVQIEEPFPWRWQIDLESGTVTADAIDDRAGEFPRMNDSLAGRPNRYLYNTLARNWEFGFNFNGVIQYDLEEGRSEEFIYPDHVTVGEHVFAPDPDGTKENDGWLLTLAVDHETKHSELLVVDARDVPDGPIARVRIPHRVPLGFHANWLAD